MTQISDETFIPLRIETISPDKPIYFNLYIFYKEQHLLYLTPGTSIDAEKLEKLKKQQVARFLIRQQEQFEYAKYLDDLVKETINDANVSVDQKVDMIEAAATSSVEAMEQEPPNATSYKMTQNTAKGLRQIVSENPDALKKLFGKPVQESEQIIKHCLNVAALAGKLASKMGLPDEEINELCTAALLHDIGLVKMTKEDRKLFNKPKRKYTPDDTRLYNFHVKKAEELLKEKPFITKMVLDLILSHEETRSGTGPMRKKKLTPCEEVLSLCNCYDKRLFTQGLTPKEVLKSIEIEEVGNYDLKLLRFFKKIVVEEGLAD